MEQGKPCASLEGSSGPWPDCLQCWCFLGSCLAHLAHPKRGERAITSPCCANTSPLHPAANCASQGGACNTFHHLYLLAGKMRRFIGPGTDIQTSKGNPVCLWRRGDPALGSQSGCSVLLADPARIHQDVEGLPFTGLLNCCWI